MGGPRVAINLEPMSLGAERLRLALLFEQEPTISRTSLMDVLGLNQRNGWIRIKDSAKELSKSSFLSGEKIYQSLKCSDSDLTWEYADAALGYISDYSKVFRWAYDKFLEANSFYALRLYQVVLELSENKSAPQFEIEFVKLANSLGYKLDAKYFRQSVLFPTADYLKDLELHCCYDSGVLHFDIKHPTASVHHPPSNADPPRQVDKQILTSPQTVPTSSHTVAKNGSLYTPVPSSNQVQVENNFDSLVDTLVRTFSVAPKETKWPPKTITPRDIKLDAAQQYISQRVKKHSGYRAAIDTKLDRFHISKDPNLRQDLIDVRGEEDTLWALQCIERAVDQSEKSNAAGFIISRLKDTSDVPIRRYIAEHRERIQTENHTWYLKLKDEIYDRKIALGREIRSANPDMETQELGRMVELQIRREYGTNYADILARNIIFKAEVSA